MGGDEHLGRRRIPRWRVPAGYQVRSYLQRAFGALPAIVTERRLRADSAFYDELGLTWADDAGIDFAVTADMSESLTRCVLKIGESEWKSFTSAEGEAPTDEERQWAEVTDFVPGWARNHKKSGMPFRYIGIRVRSRQQDLLEDDATRWRHFAVVTNMNWAGQRLLQWHREKQGTVEHGHNIMKNELAAGTLPTGKFGANAAWWRMNAIVHNALQVLKISALPKAMQLMRPKALRFHLLNIAGVVIEHGRQLTLQIAASVGRIAEIVAARLAIVALAEASACETS